MKKSNNLESARLYSVQISFIFCVFFFYISERKTFNGEQGETGTNQRLFRFYNVHLIKYAITQFVLQSLNIKCNQPRGALFMLSNVLHLKYFFLPIILVEFGGVSLPGR